MYEAGYERQGVLYLYFGNHYHKGMKFSLMGHFSPLRSRPLIYTSLGLLAFTAAALSFVIMPDDKASVGADTAQQRFIAYYNTESGHAGISDKSLMVHGRPLKISAKEETGSSDVAEATGEEQQEDIAAQMFSVDEPQPIEVIKIENKASAEQGLTKTAAPETQLEQDKKIQKLSKADVSGAAPLVKDVPKGKTAKIIDKAVMGVAAGEQPWQKYAVPSKATEGQSRVVIIIDDMGLNSHMTKRIADLPGPLELAFLPYADGVRGQAEAARKEGHEIMIHMPMEPMNGHLDMGPVALKMDMEPKVFDANLNVALNSLGGYVGINNHMGSRLTQNKEAMERLMEKLKDKGLLFVDSRTIHTSVAAETAAAYDVPYAIRDIFIDHVPTKEGVENSLKLVEEMALRRGVAIAIGHPKKVTIEALEKWLPTLAKKGIALAPVSEIVRKPSGDVSKHAQSHLQQPQ